MTDFKFQPPAPTTTKILAETSAFIRPDGPSRCTWKPGADMKSAPHAFQPHLERPKILPNVTHAVGNTPLIRLNNIPKSFGIKCEILAKCEFFNPAGSVKDRIAIRMIEDAERRGLLKPGSTIIEPTSGNTGTSPQTVTCMKCFNLKERSEAGTLILVTNVTNSRSLRLGLAMAAAVKGYHCIIVMPMKMSNEKVDALKALGAQIIRTPTAASFDSPEGLIAVAQKLCKEIPNSVILDQYRNPFNPIAHYEHTAQEIIDQCDGKLDAVVCGAGTGGTICGIGRKIKDSIPSCRVIAADPLGSSLSYPEDLNKTDVSFYEVEGIGYDFIPTVLDRSVVDKWYKTNDADSLTMARRLIREEGLLCGGSSGSAMTVAIEAAKGMSEGQRLVVILPDGMRNYMSKFISDYWLKIRGFKEIDDLKHLWWAHLPVSRLKLQNPPTIPSSMTCESAIRQMKQEGRDFAFVIKEGQIIGAVTTTKMLSSVTDSKSSLQEEVEKVVDPVRTVNESTPLGRISCIVQKEKLVLVETNQKKEKRSGNGSADIKFATSEDLLEFICNHQNSRT